MSDTSLAQKQQIRKELRDKVANLPAMFREQAAARACALLQNQTVWQNARSIFFYAPLPSELNIWALVPEVMKMKKIILLPKFDPETNSYLPFQIQNLENDLFPGKFGVHEPNGSCSSYPLKQLDLTLVPALAFDLSGNRLGRGRGFYDKLLADVSGAKCGVAFDEQIIKQVPVEPHDVPVDYLLTPTQWIPVADAKPE
ncbi:MAG: 5-formyltetrahydrofolate cyclo-ligase [Verrucomicrobia bacterium]|nr:5-formyltetrahydrofolate cyclo-ligase [Verrucomicrobiota bacterium]